MKDNDQILPPGGPETYSGAKWRGECSVCGHHHDSCEAMGCRCDYEQCSQCGFDHAYEYEEAYRWHQANSAEDSIHEAITSVAIDVVEAPARETVAAMAVVLENEAQWIHDVVIENIIDDVDPHDVSLPHKPQELDAYADKIVAKVLTDSEVHDAVKEIVVRVLKSLVSPV